MDVLVDGRDLSQCRGFCRGFCLSLFKFHIKDFILDVGVSCCEVFKGVSVDDGVHCDVGKWEYTQVMASGIARHVLAELCAVDVIAFLNGDLTPHALPDVIIYIWCVRLVF